MIKKNILAKKIVKNLEHHHEKSMRKADHLHDALISLRYEGKVSFGKNIQIMKNVIQFYGKELLPHVEVEEKVVFPFLLTHIPRIACIIKLLQAEHGDIKRAIANMESTVEKLSKAKDNLSKAKAIEKITQTGTYFTFLVQHHIQAERESVYEAIEQLHNTESKDLSRQISKFISKTKP